MGSSRPASQHATAGLTAGTVATAWAVIALPLLPVRVPLGVLLAAAPRGLRRLGALPAAGAPACSAP
ncbi:DUF6629 family protein [Streptomyces sp. NPDC006544]|uniref:DUF6629 family protein n=1 Tax=Streptomyces sp. NPDC006544 TaxID=3154583 RepID=UPI0033A0992F